MPTVKGIGADQPRVFGDDKKKEPIDQAAELAVKRVGK